MKSRKGLKRYKTIDFDSDESSKSAYHVLHNKKCLHDNYLDMYQEMIKIERKYSAETQTWGGIRLELGSGGGFLKEICADVITSDVTDVNGVDKVVNAMALPFPDNSIKTIFMVHVMHHIPDVDLFFSEAIRSLKEGGCIVAVEPYWSPAGRLFYKKLHPEPYDDKTREWKFDSTGAWSGANQALSYLILKRDKDVFKKKYPSFKLVYDRPFNGLRYIATGGLWLRPLLPNCFFPLLTKLEKLFSPLMYVFGIHHLFVIKKWSGIN